MAKKKNTKPIVYPVLFMLLLTVIFGGALAFINEATKGVIASQESLRVKENVLYVLGIQGVGQDAAAPDSTTIEDLYAKTVTERMIGDTQVYIGKKDGQLIGYAFLVNGAGLWGSITGYAAVSGDLTQILGASFTAHSETPGLGGRIDETWFKEQFRGVKVDLSADSMIFRPKNNGNVDAITGATITSEAVRVLLNADIVEFIKTVGGEL